MSKLSVLLLYGGESSEHQVSIKSAHNVYAALDNEKYDVSLGFIDPTGKWWLVESIDGGHTGQPQLLPALGQGQFITLPESVVLRPDVILPILHGKHGEDGTVQGLADLLHIPCAGPSVLSAAVTMDKDTTKRLLRDANIPVVPWVSWHTSQPKPRYDELSQVLSKTLFVKPSRAGSSVGVSKVTDQSEWQPALDQAAEHDDTVLIEQAIDAREVELAVLGNSLVQASGAGEIVTGDQFYSFDEKYAASSQAHLSIPANLTDDQLHQLQAMAKHAYEATGGHGMARVDFFIDEQGEIYLNEINSIPGFTNISMYPKLWRESGISYPDLINRLISLALEK